MNAVLVTAGVSIATFVLGLYLGHRLSVLRDRRKEFNEAALPIRGWLLGQLSRPEPYEGKPTELELDTFASCIRRRDRARFETAFADYRREAARSGYGAYGLVMEDEAAYRAAVGGLLPFTSRR